MFLSNYVEKVMWICLQICMAGFQNKFSCHVRSCQLL